MQNENKTIHLYHAEDSRFTWEGNAADLVDYFMVDAEMLPNKESRAQAVESFAWALAALADGCEKGAQRQLRAALDMPDLVVECY